MVFSRDLNGGLERYGIHWIRIGDCMAEPQTTPRSDMNSGWRPGDGRADIPSMLRVDQAGEYGATRIYAGQLAVFGDRHPASRPIATMKMQEQRHLETFDAMLAERGVRPTVLQPIWNIAGYWLGAATALISPSAAMACTAAVETEIDKHYAEQLRMLGSDEPDLGATIEQFQAEELEHRDIAIQSGAESAVGYPILSAVIRAGCRAAIALSKRI
jgi:3-demethoxyubiquinol 3-hydroxylase